MNFLKFVLIFATLLVIISAERQKRNAVGKGKDRSKVEKNEENIQEDFKKKWAHIKQGVKKVHGTLKHEGRKFSKRQKFVNQKSYVWRGKVVNMKGPSANDTAPSYYVPNADALKHEQSCKDQSRVVSGRGPSADGAQQENFQPCQGRRRGGEKRGKWTDEPFAEAQNFYYPQRDSSPRSQHRTKRSETYSSSNLLWKNPERILIMFDRSYPEQYRPNGRKAYSFWQNNTCLKFIEKPTGTVLNEQHILLKFTGVGQCSTDRLGPDNSKPFSTTIDTTTCYNLTGSIAHEIGHALGLAHSQKRVDRDGAVAVNMGNIPRSWQSQFEKDNDKLFDEWGVPYFYNSIMHYFPYAASSNGLMTICPLDPIMEAVMGQREEPAFGDISLINRIYCQESCFYKNELQRLPFNGNLSLTISGRTCQNWASQSPQKHRFTSVGNHDSCRNPDNWSGGPWCYTKDPAVPYEPCFSSCEDLEAARRPFCYGWCYNGGYHHATNCECVCPRFATGRFCESLDMSKKYSHISCGGKIDLQRGSPKNISSPNYPQNYGQDSVCIWWVKAPDGMKVKATITDFMIEIPDSNGCYDYVEIRKSICAPTKNHPEDMRYCGNSLTPNPRPQVINSDQGDLVIKFYSDEQETAKGFNMILDAV